MKTIKLAFSDIVVSWAGLNPIAYGEKGDFYPTPP